MKWLAVRKKETEQIREKSAERAKQMETGVRYRRLIATTSTGNIQPKILP